MLVADWYLGMLSYLSTQYGIRETLVIKESISVDIHKCKDLMSTLKINVSSVDSARISVV